jgi:hypothetical protein
MIDHATSTDRRILWRDKATNTPLPTPLNPDPCPQCLLSKNQIIILQNEVTPPPLPLLSLSLLTCLQISRQDEDLNFLKELLDTPELQSPQPKSSQGQSVRGRSPRSTGDSSGSGREGTESGRRKYS